MQTTIWKLATIILALLCVALAACQQEEGKSIDPTVPIAQQQGGSGGPPNDMGGPPAGTMVDVAGCAYFDEVLDVWRLRKKNPDGAGCLDKNSETDWKLDFGPEPYCPDPCLTGELITDQLDGINPVTIKIGMNLVGTFRWSDDLSTILAQTDSDGPAYNDGEEPYMEWIPFTPAEGTNFGRPKEGRWARVFGRAGETEYAVLVWEIRYNWHENDYLNWYWWRTAGQPWAKMWLLDCGTPGEE